MISYDIPPSACRRSISSSRASIAALRRDDRKGFAGQKGVRGARVNLASKRVTVEWDEGAQTPQSILDRLQALGYPAYPFAAERRDGAGGRHRAACSCDASPRPRSGTAALMAICWRCGPIPAQVTQRTLRCTADGARRAGDRRLRRPAVLRSALARVAPARDQHGCADRARRRADDWRSRSRDVRRTRRPISTARRCCWPSCSPAATSISACAARPERSPPTSPR